MRKQDTAVVWDEQGASNQLCTGFSQKPIVMVAELRNILQNV